MQMKDVMDTSQPVTTKNAVGVVVSFALETLCNPKDSVDESEGVPDALEDA